MNLVLDRANGSNTERRINLAVSQDELMYLQSQLEGLESIFLELLPVGVELKRQQVQDYYDKRFSSAIEPQASVAENELRRQFNTKANQVRNLVDSAESLGDAGNKVNLIRAAASLPSERNRPLKGKVMDFCTSIVLENRTDPDVFSFMTECSELGPVEARVMLATVIFATEEIHYGQETMSLKEMLSQIVELIRSKHLLPRNDPFLNEALCAIESMEDEA
jgi:hypothetical protein